MIIENCRRLRAPQRWGECFPPPRNLKATGRVELGHLGQGKQKPAPVPSSTWPRGVARPGDPKMTATDANSCRARPVVGCARQLVVFRRSTDQRATPPRRPHRAAATRPLRLTARPRPTRARPPSTAEGSYLLSRVRPALSRLPISREFDARRRGPGQASQPACQAHGRLGQHTVQRDD